MVILEKEVWVTFNHLGGKTLLEEQLNDQIKEQLAKENGIENYVVIDCRR